MKNAKVLTKQLVKSVNELEKMIKQKSDEQKLRDEFEKKMKETWRKVIDGKAQLRTYENRADKYQVHKGKCTELSSLIGKAFYEIRKKLEGATFNGTKLEKCTCTYGWILVLSDLVLVNKNYEENGYIEEILTNMDFQGEFAIEFKEEYLKHNDNAIKIFYQDSKEFIEKGCKF